MNIDSIGRCPKHTPIKDRIEQQSERVTESGCWIWMRRLNYKGYGVIGYLGKTCPAHRIAYEAFVGPIPEGLMVLHRCDVRSCVNPAHLFLGTDTDNAQDRSRKGRNGVGYTWRESRITRRARHKLANRESGV